MRVLALDHGLARCGCAISDPTGTIATPLEAIEPDPGRAAALAAEHGADLVVVGLPIGLDGEEGDQAALARAFRDELDRLVEIPVETHDERLTTRMAERSAKGGARGAPDSLAAAHLLESFLAARSAGGDAG